MRCVRLTRSDHKTCFKLVDGACAQVIRSPDDVYAHVYRVGCPPEPSYRTKYDGCTWTTEKIPAPEPRKIKYPAFEVDDKFRVCFFWDKLLFDQPNGRYTVDIFVCDQLVDTAQLQLGGTIRVAEIVNPTGALCHGCDNS